MPTPTPDIRVFKWLGTDSKGLAYYLHPLNLSWSEEGVEHDLQVYRRVADLLAADPAYWGQIISAANWRHSLVGCTCLLASGRREFYDDLCLRFRAGSFVAPQIAATLGLLHGSSATPFFESLLDDPALRKKPRQAVSANRVLSLLGKQPHDDIKVDSWEGRERDEADLAEKIVNEQWLFWSDRLVV